MIDIIKRSGGSLATAYGLFENKAGLLRAIITDRCASLNRSIVELVSTHGPPDEVLRKIGHRFLTTMLDHHAVGLLRIIVAESLRDPSIGEHFRESAPEKGTQVLSQAFARWHAEGQLSVDNPRAAAESFTGLLIHRFQLEAMCGIHSTVTDSDVSCHVNHVVDMILCYYRPSAEDACRARPS